MCPSASYSQIVYPQEETSLKVSTVQEETQISNNFSIYLQEHEVDLEMKENDPVNLRQALQSFNAHKWIDAMNEEMKSTHDNDLWDHVELPEGLKPIGCKWIFKTKRDSKGNKERYKACLVAKGFTQREGIDYNKTFSPVLLKDSFRFIMALVAYFDLKLHQMGVKTAFLNGEIDETIYMVQPKKKKFFCEKRSEVHGLQIKEICLWTEAISSPVVSQISYTSSGFVMNSADECIYHKFSGSKYIFLVLNVDDILLATNDLNLLCDTKKFFVKQL